VAHFDDAVIWAGGAIRKTRALGWDWTVVCTCAAEGSRRHYFLASCEALGAHGIALDFLDHPDGAAFSRNDRLDLAAAVKAAVGGHIDWVFTHSLRPTGEYGFHPNHTEAALAATELVESGVLLRPHGVAHFAYGRIYNLPSISTAATPDATHYVQLDYDDLAWKAAWCAHARDVELLDPTLGGLSWLEKLGWPCPNPEAFASADLELPVAFVQR